MMKLEDKLKFTRMTFRLIILKTSSIVDKFDKIDTFYCFRIVHKFYS